MGLQSVVWAMACVMIAVAVVAVVIGAAILVMRKGRGGAPLAGGASTYEGRKYLMSRGEAAFYRVLVQAAGSELVVMAKVRLGDVVDVRGGSASTRMSGSNRIRQKHVDFVLLDARDLRIRVVVELDDKTHEREDRRERDGFVDEVLRHAGVPVVRVKAAAGYRVEEVGRRLREG